ncbi:MAG: AAA family ATPase [Muribaculaceae bacterium]|nr:AAA family ATPase [Muribaculaceae bacterium]
MTLEEFNDIFFGLLPYTPTRQQRLIGEALVRFCSTAMPGESVFLLNGYAGTGKTSLIGALVKALSRINIPTVLLAPTGRAAKVFSAMAGRAAYTIHRRIYTTDAMGNQNLVVNSVPYTVFIVDEASMIGADAGENGSSLLADLMSFCFAADNCKLILMGDTAQLPPVGCDRSPAMDPEVIKRMGLKMSRAVMTDVVRQSERSEILHNATWLRRAMLQDPLPVPKLFTGRGGEVAEVDTVDLPDELSTSYSEVGIADTILITRSNKRATGFNLAIRANILDHTEMLVAGDRLLVAKNNYHWSAKVKGVDFIANGDIAVVDHIIDTEERYGFRFADVILNLPDRDINLECKIILNPLTTDFPALTRDETALLMQARIDDPESEANAARSESAMRRALRSDPYINALQVKYGYAVTCHKAQGGQWSDVFVDTSFIPVEAMGMEFYRWLYTATTRARRRLRFIAPTTMVESHD